jgi:hypothetical protein
VADAEGHYRLDTGCRDLLDGAVQLAFRDPENARHGLDRGEVVEFFLDEDWVDQVIQRDRRFLHQIPHYLAGAQAAQACQGEAIDHSRSS